MLAVSDTTPLNYLLQIDAVHLLPALYQRICVPAAVRREMKQPKAPPVVRQWIVSPPDWLFVVPDLPLSSLEILALDEGEAQAIAAYESLKADFLLTDDKAARRVAESRGIRVVTTLLVLDAAADRGWINLSSAIERLRKTNFRVSAFLIDELLHKRP